MQAQTDIEKSFALRALGGNEKDGYVYFNFWSSGPAADKWQVLSPIKGEAGNADPVLHTDLIDELTKLWGRAPFWAPTLTRHFGALRNRFR
jgi:hypothetical protein